jgi:hypothetical protein
MYREGAKRQARPVASASVSSAPSRSEPAKRDLLCGCDCHATAVERSETCQFGGKTCQFGAVLVQNQESHCVHSSDDCSIEPERHRKILPERPKPAKTGHIGWSRLAFLGASARSSVSSEPFLTEVAPCLIPLSFLHDTADCPTVQAFQGARDVLSGRKHRRFEQQGGRGWGLRASSLLGKAKPRSAPGRRGPLSQSLPGLGTLAVSERWKSPAPATLVIGSLCRDTGRMNAAGGLFRGDRPVSPVC